MAEALTYKANRKRIPTSIEYRWKITNYGVDNLYPQTVETIVNASPVTTKAVDALKKFLRGQGWFENGDIVINSEGQTIDKLTRLITADKALYCGYAIHVNTNALGGITEARHVPFENVRLGIPDEFGRYTDVKVSNNWEADQYKMKGRQTPQTFPLFEYWDISDESGDYGYMIYVTEAKNKYPLSSADPILDSAQTDGEIQVFELGSIQNGFLGTSVFKHPGEFESEGEKNRFRADLKTLQGAGNAGSIFMLETPPDFDGDLLENIPANNNDRLFELTNENVIDRIVTNYGVPISLMGIQPDGGMFNQEQMVDSYVYYNSYTRDDRTQIAKELEEIFSYWHLGQIDLSAGIKENEFNTQLETITQDKLISLIEKRNSGAITQDVAIQILLTMYGVEEDKAVLLLGPVPEKKEVEQIQTDS